MTDATSRRSDLVIRYASSEVHEEQEYAVISTNVLPNLTEVRLYEETVQHAKDGHGGEFPADFPSMVRAVAQAVSDPTYIEQGYKGYVFVDERTTNRTGNAFRVPVKHHSGTSGLVKTYYFANRENSSQVIYRRKDAE